MAKRRVLGKIVLPFTSRELLKQLRQAMKALEPVIVPTPYCKEDFAHLLEKYPLLASPLSALRPADWRFFWDTFGVWLLEKRFEHEISVLGFTPSIGRHAHHTDVEVLAFASQHPWPSIFWRDIHCYRCFLLKTLHPTGAFDKQCSKHRCQTWAKQLLTSHTPVEPKWSHFTDIGAKYGEVVGFLPSDESDDKLLSVTDQDEVQSLQAPQVHFEKNREPVMAWASSGQVGKHDETEDHSAINAPVVHSGSKKKSGKKQSDTRRKSVSQPLQFLNKFKTVGNTHSKHRMREHKVKMKKGGKKYQGVPEHDTTHVQILKAGSSSSSDVLY